MITDCRHCGEPFEFWAEGTKGWGPRAPVEIICPHCGQVHGHEVTLGYVRSERLTPERHDAYEKSKGAGR